MKAIITLMFLWCGQALAEAEWLCEQESGLRQGASIYACGMGEAMSEPFARERALSAAIREFNTICELSSDCSGHEKVAEPKRMSCYHDKSGLVRCYRLVVFTVR